MTIVDSQISEAVQNSSSSNTVLEDDRIGWKRCFQEQMNVIADKFVNNLRELYRQEIEHSQEVVMQLPISLCVIATKVEMEALRVNLIQRYHLFSGVYMKDRFVKKEIEKPSGGYSSSTVKETIEERISHECSENRVNVTKMMGWERDEEEECWQLTFNFFNVEKGTPAFIQPQPFGFFPLTTILSEVDVYIGKVGGFDEVVKKYAPYYSSWVQYRISQISWQIKEALEARAESSSCGGKVILPECIFSTESEINLLCQHLFQQFGLKVMHRERNEHLHAPDNEPYNLTRQLGAMHRGSKSKCRQLEMHVLGQKQRNAFMQQPLHQIENNDFEGEQSHNQFQQISWNQ